MQRTKKHLTLRIAALKESIRRKYRQFKDGGVESERLLEKQYKPLIKELKKVKKEPDIEIKQEEEEQDPEMEVDGEAESFSPGAISSPFPRKAEGHDLSTLVSTPDDLETVSRYVETHFENQLTRKYMKLLMEDAGGRNQIIDHDFGPRYDIPANNLMIGDKVLDFGPDGAILINNTRYSPTEGLYELIFKRLPSDDLYTDDDLKTYKSILIATNAHKKGYKYHNNLRRDNSLKYRHVIKDLFGAGKVGKGIGTWKSTKSHDLVHWDDPNELVGRLKLLVMSAEAGNNSHRN